MTNPDLRDITEKFIRKLWNLNDSGKFPKDVDIHSTITFEPNCITVKSVAMPISLDIYDDRVEVPWMNPPLKVYAADPQYFDLVLAALAHFMLFSSMGWDSTFKVGEYTKKRVQELINEGYKSPGDIFETQVPRKD